MVRIPNGSGTTNRVMGKYIFRFGLLASAIIIGLLFLTVYLRDGTTESYSSVQWIGQLGILIGLCTMYFGIKQFRNREQQGYISLPRAFTLGLLISVMVSVLYVATWVTYLVSSGQGAAISETMMEEAVTKSNRGYETEATLQAQQQVANMFGDMFSSPFAQGVLAFLEIFPAALLVAFMCALMLKKEREVEYQIMDY